MTLPIVLVIVGFVLLIKGANWLVSGASMLARQNNVPDLVVGLTIVAFGTSAPELVVNLVAAYEGHSDIVFGNIIGSNNFNLFVCIGIIGLISPIVVQSSTVYKEIPISFVAAVVLFFLANDLLFEADGGISRTDGLILILGFGLFLWYIYKQMKGEKNLTHDSVPEVSTLRVWGLVVVGLGGLIAGGQLVVDNAILIAQGLGISQKTIGLTIIAAGTSLPELVTSVVAASRKNTDIAVGNLIGSNIFNILLVLSLSAFIRPTDYNVAFNTELYLLMGGTLFLFAVMFVGKKHTLEAWQAAALLVAFTLYTSHLLGLVSLF